VKGVHDSRADHSSVGASEEQCNFFLRILLYSNIDIIVNPHTGHVIDPDLQEVRDAFLFH